MAIDEMKLNQFLGKAVGDVAATFSAALVAIGDRLGLYRAMADAGDVTPAELAGRTGTDERLVREWLANQAAGGYVTYDPETGRFSLTAEQAFVLANRETPADIAGIHRLALSVLQDEEAVADAFRTGRGFGWNRHHSGLFEFTDRFFRAGYRANLVPSWIPALNGVVEKLQAGARVADVGCGYGSSSLLLAEAYPTTQIRGFDSHDASIAVARQRAADAGLSGRVSFDVASASEYPGQGYDLVMFFDALHDMGDPVGAIRHVRETLAPGGRVMLVEPFASDRLEENLNPVGRLFYAASTLICVPNAIAQETRQPLGAQAGPNRLKAVLNAGGLSRVRIAAQTPFNLVIEAQP